MGAAGNCDVDQIRESLTRNPTEVYARLQSVTLTDVFVDGTPGELSVKGFSAPLVIL